MRQRPIRGNARPWLGLRLAILAILIVSAAGPRPGHPAVKAAVSPPHVLLIVEAS